MKNIAKNINSFFISPILLILTSGLLLRILVVNFGTVYIDHNTFIAWSRLLAEGGFANFYNNWCDYLPGYLYILFLLGKISQVIPISTILLYKLPAIIADIATGGIVYLIVKKLKDEKWGIIASALYIFNPAVLGNSAMWGQVDSLTSLFSLASVWFFGMGNIFVSAILLAIATLTKPQGAFVVPVILYLIAKKRVSIKNIILFGLTGGTVFILGFLPFLGDRNLVNFILERVAGTVGQYPYTAINAFNFWGIWGQWIPDNPVNQIVGISAILVLIAVLARRFWKTEGGEYLLLTVSFLTNFLFFTRMHERHMLPIFAPFAISLTLIPSLIIPFVIYSITYILNLNYSYNWILQDSAKLLSNSVTQLISIINTLLVFAFFLPKIVLKKFKAQPLSFPEMKISARNLKIILCGIILFSAISRLLFLSNPKNEYFDEVYHAFTARQMLHGNPMAWEWWNTPPQGFAYEWTHPPLAKLGMIVGMKIWGENSFGWRFPGAVLGVGSVFLIYLIASKIFKDELVGVLSAAVFSLDGLPLVLSRIGMNDSYFLFFALLSFYLYLKDEYLFSAIFWGASLASKWSALWAVPIFILAHFIFKKKFSFKYLWFVIIPPLIYLASYLPMFTSGHTFEQFIGVQKQMWWYHTGLKATHPYTSSWFSWPFLVRPIWLYTSGIAGDMIANIYAMGNPLVFWFGLVSVTTLFVIGVREANKKFLFIVFAYLVFFVPWALSPRIMFLYHYLPSLPFLAIATGIILRRNPKIIFPVIVIMALSFIYFYPHWTGIKIPQVLDTSYYWLDSWK